MLGEILDDLLTSPSTGPCITATRHFAPRPPVLVPFPPSLDPRIADALRARGIDELYSVTLPHHTKWATLFQNLRYVVIDELHAYRGVFGSHLANVLRRLHRICRHYGATPQFVMASATIANPGELARRLVGEPVEAIAESGAPTGDKTFVCYNPPVVNHELGIRAPYLGESAKLALRFLPERI